MKTIVSMVWILGAVLAQAADPVGKPISVQGSVSAQAPTAPVRALAVKGPVFMQDVIRTAAEAKTQILFADDTVFSQGPNTEVVIDEFVYDPVNTKNNGFKARVERGVFRTVTGKITDLNQDRFEIKTGRATIGIRGCGVSARLSDKRDEISIDYVRTGRVVVVTPFGGRPVEFREPGLLVIEDGGRVRKQRFDSARFVTVLAETTPGGKGRRGPMNGPGDDGFRRDGSLFQEEIVTLAGRKPNPPAPPPPDHNPPGPAPWPVLQGEYGGFAMNQWEGTLNINPLASYGVDPLNAAENMSLTLDSGLADPARPGGSLYDWPISVSIPPAYRMPVFGQADPSGTITSHRLDADTFQAHMVGADYDVTMLIERGGPDSDWYRCWWGMGPATPAQVRNADNMWVPCQGFGVVGNTYGAAETAALKNGAASYTLQQSGTGWAGGLGHYSWNENNVSDSGTFVMQGAPVGTIVRVGGGQDSWSTRLQLHSTGASGVPAECDVDLTGSLLDANNTFTAVVSPTVNTLILGGHDFGTGGPQAFGTGRLVGKHDPGQPPTGLIGAVTMDGTFYNTFRSGSFAMNINFGTDLKPFEGGGITP